MRAIFESAIAGLEAIRTWYIEQGVPDIGERFVEETVTSQWRLWTRLLKLLKSALRGGLKAWVSTKTV